MSNIRLYQFPSKAAPVPADIVYLGDSAASFDEVQCTIAQVIGAYPNLLALAGLTLGNNEILATNGSAVLASTGALPGNVQLDVASFNMGTGASASTFWRGDGSWQPFSSSGGLTWNNISGVAATMAANNGYVSNNAGVVALTLPATSAIGDVIAIAGNPASAGWSVVQGAGQRVYIGSSPSTLGAGGSIASSDPSDSLTIVCVAVDTIWVTVGGPQGTITIV